MKIWVYEGRNRPIELYYSFTEARRAQDIDNGCTLEEAIEDDSDWGGSENEGHFYIDDGGSLSHTEVLYFRNDKVRQSLRGNND